MVRAINETTKRNYKMYEATVSAGGAPTVRNN